MKRFLPLLLLTACVTPQTMRARAPDYSATSPRTVQQIAGCIGSSWHGPALTSSPIEGGLSLAEIVGEDVNVMVEIADHSGARAVTVYFRHYIVSFQDTHAITARVTACL